jgi:hypothetical protein
MVKRMMKRKIRQFNGRSKYGTITGRGIGSFASEDLGNTKEKKFRSVMVVMDLTFVMELLLFLCQRRKSFRCRF